MEIVFELLIQIIAELLAEFGIRGTKNALGLEKPKNPFLSTFGYLILASIGAGISLLIFPNHHLDKIEYRILNLVLTPLLIGYVMSVRGKILTQKMKDPIKLDTFAYGYLFALTFGLIRFFFAH